MDPGFRQKFEKQDGRQKPSFSKMPFFRKLTEVRPRIIPIRTSTNRVSEAVPLFIFLDTSEVGAFCMRHIKFGGSWFQAEIRKTGWPPKTISFENSIFSEINRGNVSHYPYSY